MIAVTFVPEAPSLDVLSLEGNRQLQLLGLTYPGAAAALLVLGDREWVLECALIVLVQHLL